MLTRPPRERPVLPGRHTWLYSLTSCESTGRAYPVTGDFSTTSPTADGHQRSWAVMHNPTMASYAYLAPSDPARPQPGRANDEEADRSENAVLSVYLSHLTAKGHRVLQHRVVTDPDLAPTDLFDAAAGEVVMACHRFHYRALITAYGVISDCERLFSSARRALLFTAEPGPAAREFLSHHKIITIWPEDESFVRTDPAAEAGGA